MNIDRIIFLNWLDIEVARLIYVDDKYIFQIVEDNLKRAKEKFCPLDILIYKNSEKGVHIANTLPVVFREFKIPSERIELFDKYGITKDDDEFTKLYKLAINSNDVNNNGFWISTYSISLK